MHDITLFFHDAFDKNVFCRYLSIRVHQDGLERRERHPGGVQQDNSCWYNIDL